LLYSNPVAGEKININGRASFQLQTFFQNVADLHSLNNLPLEGEIVFIDNRGSLQLLTFLQLAADSAGITAPAESENLTDTDGKAAFTFQIFLDNLAA